MGLMQEFKEFAMKGNVVDMAVGIIIGAAFGKIVSTLVNSMVMPPLGWAIGGVNFSELSWELGKNATTGEPVVVGYGLFLQALLDFLHRAALFLAIKLSTDEAPPSSRVRAPPEQVLRTRNPRLCASPSA